jgi:hypothetical protein
VRAELARARMRVRSRRFGTCRCDVALQNLKPEIIKAPAAPKTDGNVTQRMDQ